MRLPTPKNQPAVPSAMTLQNQMRKIAGAEQINSAHQIHVPLKATDAVSKPTAPTAR